MAAADPVPARSVPDRINPFEHLSAPKFKKKYRFSKHEVRAIAEMLKDGDLDRKTERSKALSKELQICIALNFFAKGSIFDDIATSHNVDCSTVSRCVHCVAQALCNIKKHVIKFPKEDEDVQRNMASFRQTAGFPRISGVIDCTHVGLHGTKLGEHEYIYRNRHQQYSINVQLVCDANCKITNVVARWPGSTHDSRILQNSKLAAKFHEGQLQGIILGDSGYPLLPWLMTPILDPQTAAEQAYNIAHRKTRVIIEEVNGQIKNKFRCLLGHGMQIQPHRACNIITACCVLFNLSKEFKRDERDEEDEDEDSDDDDERQREEERRDAVDDHINREIDPTGVAVRADIVRTFDT
ncbi:putative nuclease HARBI1 [Diadema setosum]|uniref:putative nuclease HARBI1 n=1 Tax=Diadema setosum TaxID=31175 RepID=UPI003B3A3231